MSGWVLAPPDFFHSTGQCQPGHSCATVWKPKTPNKANQMGFLSTSAAKSISGGGNTGGYLSASKLSDGESMRFSIVSEEPLEFFCVWGENAEGTKKPFRFVSEPSPSDNNTELGEFTQRMNYEGTELEKPKFAISFFVFDYQTETIKVLEIGQKGLMKELDKLSQEEEYSDLSAWDMKISRTGVKLNTEYRLMPIPRKKGSDEKIAAAVADSISKGYEINQLLVGGNPFGAA